MISIAALMRLLPRPAVQALDAWAARAAAARIAARRKGPMRKTHPLPPVLNGYAYLPHPWRD